MLYFDGCYKTIKYFPDFQCAYQFISLDKLKNNIEIVGVGVKVGMDKCKYLFRVLLLLPIVLSQGIMAAEKDVTFSGFASLVYAKTVGSDEGLLNNITDEGEYRDFNTLGLRMDADLHEHVSFVAQMVAYGNENYEPDFDWIFASIELNSEFRLDIGKTRIPMYMYSDFIDVGYAYQWVEPPSTVYVAGRSFFQSVDGLKLNYVTNMGEWDSELLLYGGRAEQHFTSIEGTEQVALYIDNVIGGAWTIERQWLTLRVVHSEGNITLEGYSRFDQLLAGIHGLGVGINAVAPYVDQSVTLINTYGIEDSVALRDDQLKFSGISAGMDFGQVFTVLEITQSLFNGNNIAVNDSKGGYLTLGVRLPQHVTLSANYGTRKQQSNKKISAEYDALVEDYIPLTSIIPDAELQAALSVINASIPAVGNGIMNALNVAQDDTVKEYSLQLRWDFHKSAAFKFEYLMQDNDQFSPTTYLPERVQPKAFRLGLDLVF